MALQNPCPKSKLQITSTLSKILSNPRNVHNLQPTWPMSTWVVETWTLAWESFAGICYLFVWHYALPILGAFSSKLKTCIKPFLINEFSSHSTQSSKSCLEKECWREGSPRSRWQIFSGGLGMRLGQFQVSECTQRAAATRRWTTNGRTEPPHFR